MSLRVIVGAGGTATATARLLADAGDSVRMVTRSGAGPEHPLIERIALDAGSVDELTALTEGAATLFNTAMPEYHSWPDTVPPLFGAIRNAAERAGADYVTLGNLYGYGPVDGPITEDHPLAATGSKGKVRARMWLEAKAAHDEGKVRATEVRAGQFLGAGAFSLFTFMVQPKVLAGRLAVIPANLDTPHAYSAIDDVARSLVAVANDDRSWGRPWHAPVIHRSVHEVAVRLAQLAGAPIPRVESMTDHELTTLGFTAPFWDELWETEQMSHRPFLVDATRIERTFGVKASTLDDVLAPVARPA